MGIITYFKGYLPLSVFDSNIIIYSEMKRNSLIYPLIVLLAIIMMACSCSRNNDTDPDENGNTLAEFYFGADLSYVNQIEDKGGIFKENNIGADPFTTLKKYGTNLVRLRLWHNPVWVKDIYGSSSVLYSGYEDVEKGIQRAKNAGMEVLLDFHYSDTWADPGKQYVPAAWEEIISIDVLCDSVYNYTYSVLNKLKAKNLLPEMVQIGNETNCGMMISGTKTGFPNLNVCNGNWVNIGKVINAAIDAVKQIDTEAGVSTKIILHVADPKNLDWWMGEIISKGKVTRFHIMGFSYYHIWHSTIGFSDLSNAIKSLKNKYNKDMMVLETAYPFTSSNNDNYPNIYYNQTPVEGFPYTVEGQKNFLISLTQKMVDAGAIGVIYWEPAWITSGLTDLWNTGSSWDNCTFYNFSGNLTEAVDYIKYPYNTN